MPADPCCREYDQEMDRDVAPGAAPGLAQAQWCGALGGIVGELERLPSLTEKRFLAVGTKLQEVSALLQEIAANSADAARIMSGDEAVTVIRQMERLLNGMDGYFDRANGTAERACTSLGAICAELGSIHRMMTSFKDQVGTLRMLKMLTNIQGACLAGRGLGLRNVASDIDALSRNVHAKSSAIIGKTKELRADLERAVAMVTGLEGRQRQLTRLVVTALRSNIGSLAEMHGRCSAAARDVSGGSAAIARDVSQVVVAMQFQDITRQQMEHVREALDGMRRRLPGSTEDAAGCPRPGELGDLCALQSVQLAHSASELAAAVAGIDRSLRGISRAAAGSAAEVHGLFALADTVGHAAIAEIEGGLASIAGAFAENVEANRNLARIMLTVTTAVGEITTFAEDIDYLGSEIRLIALNAIIKAAQAGKEGAAFNVIAETVKRQSEEICQQAAVITSTIRAITLHVEALQGMVAEGGTGADGETETALQGDGVAATLAQLKGLTDTAAGILAKTDAAADMLTGGIEEALATLDCRDIMDIIRRDVIAPLDRVVWTARRAAPREPGATGLERVEQLYTMRSERKVHQLFAASLAGGSCAAAAPGGADDAGGCRGDEGFGDNVELF